jgi:hypothetical protein
MEEKNLIQSNNDVMELLSKLSMAHISFNNKFMEITSRLNSLEKELATRVYVSSGQRSVIRKHVKAAVMDISAKQGWEYKLVSRKLFNAIYESLNSQYNVPSYTDLPAKEFEEIIYRIDNWKLKLFVKENIEMKLRKE